jgi:TM2 domain-containing membrane protein YozV
MKFLRPFLFIGYGILLVLVSCTMEKRVYMPGYHTEWAKSKDNRTKKVFAEEQTVLITNQESETKTVTNSLAKTVSEDNTTASTDNAIYPILKPNKLDINIIRPEDKKQNRLEDCDILTLKNGDELKVKVTEIGTSEIKYKRCDNPNGPTITVRKSEVFSIKYSNGTKDVFSNSNSSSIESANITNPSGDKSLVITLVLWFFLGILGIHRFYLGHIGMGVLYLLTGGLCGIGWIIDIILLLTGGLKPRNGEFKDSL